MKNLSYKELSALAKEKGINPVGKKTDWLIEQLSKTEKTNTDNKEVKFKNKKGEVTTASYVRDYLYPKTQETYLVVSVNGKNRLIRKHQLCD